MHFDLPSGRAQFRWHGHQIQRSGTEGGKNFEIDSLANRRPFTGQRSVSGKCKTGKKVGVSSEPQAGQNTLVREKPELLPACCSSDAFSLKIQPRNRGEVLFSGSSSAQISEVRGCGLCADAARILVTSRLFFAGQGCARGPAQGSDDAVRPRSQRALLPVSRMPNAGHRAAMVVRTMVQTSACSPAHDKRM